MKTTIKKQGNSLVVNIPNSLAEQIGIVADSLVDLSIVDGHLRIIADTREPTLKELLQQVTNDNRHPAIYHDIKGRESW